MKIGNRKEFKKIVFRNKIFLNELVRGFDTTNLISNKVKSTPKM
jgi:hypothetical protein